MFPRMSFVSYLLLTASSTLATVISLYTDPANNLFVNVEEGLGLHRIVLTGYSQTFRAHGDQPGRTEYVDLQVSFPTSHGQPLFNVQMQDHEMVYTDDSYAISTMGVGPGGFFQQTARSVSVIRFVNQTGEIILGLSVENFVQEHCVANSSLTMPFFQTGSFGAGLNRMSPFGTVQIEGSHREPSLVEINFSDTWTLLSLPYVMILDIYHVLGVVGPVEDHTQVRFSDCETIIEHLPVVDLAFSDNRDIMRTIGVLRLSPQDYVRQLGNNICELLVVSGPAWMVWFNPLLLPDVNIHTTEDHMTICDILN